MILIKYIIWHICEMECNVDILQWEQCDHWLCCFQETRCVSSELFASVHIFPPGKLFCFPSKKSMVLEEKTVRGIKTILELITLYENGSVHQGHMKDRILCNVPN